MMSGMSFSATSLRLSLLRHKEALLGALAVGFLVQMMEPLDDVGDVVLRNLAALVIQRKTIGLHIVKPDVFGAARAGLCEHQHRRGYARIGLEHAGGHGNHRPQLMVFHQLLADGLVRLGRAEQNAVRHDAGAAPALFQHPQKQRQEQQLGLFGVGHGLQVIVDALRVHSPLEGRIRQADGEPVTDLILLGNAVAVINFRVADGVEW